MKTRLLVLVIWLILPWMTLDASDLMLNRDFQIASVVQMPRADLPGLSLNSRVYPEPIAIEWQVRLQAPTAGESPLFENVPSADFTLTFPSEQPVALHWSKGSHSEVTDFQPRRESLVLGQPFALESFGGRSSDGVMPYFNLASDGGGLIVAVGWPGDWKASFEALPGGKVHIAAGVKRSRFHLRAGESVRLPAVLVMSYRGDWIDGQNQFRRLMLHHFTPKTHAPMDLMPIAASVHGMFGFNVTTEENLTALAGDIAALKLPLDTFWLDAGWNEGGFPAGQGNPLADPTRFPRGLAPVGEAVRKTGLRFLTWFEPERAMRGTWLDREHPDWLLSSTGTPEPLRYMEKDGFRLLDMSNPEARTWALDTISQEIRAANIAIYRQDFNEYPSYFWHTDESPDAVGLREVRYINGLYDFLDELNRRHPQLIIDNCASGGRRFDFEMLRRSVVLWRSDSCWDDKDYPRNVQAMTHGLSHWTPLHGLGSVGTDDVSLRSGMGACASFAINYRDPQAVAGLRKHLDRYQKVRPYFAADYYPLTEWSDDPKQWLAFQFHDAAQSAGLIQAFCGAGATLRTLTLKLQGLDRSKTYLVTNWDQPESAIERSGESLVDEGISISVGPGNAAVVLEYARLE